ncbi:MAG: hypothetical protein JOZ61_11415 [Verrucomicrobia bacterium]|nr:hypothetical protein [Verrucomicrobiota bacterium]
MLQEVTKEVVGIHVLLTHSLFVCDILRSFFGTFLKEYRLLLGSPRGGGWHESCLTST